MFDVDEVLAALSASEKVALLSGSDFWHTVELPEHSVPPIRFSDGPNGIRGTRFFAGVPAACIPCGTALGATWDKALLRQAGELLGKECIAKGVHSWLGPTINIQRSPLGGRGFESYSEDPYLSGVLAVHVIQGCESTGVQSVVKHFVCNDQEDERRAVDTLVTPRALREIYARPFQIVARDANPGCLMTSYNKVNGTHVSQNKELLDDLVRDEWKWDPLIVSDWLGTYSTEHALKAGLDLEMPGPSKYRGHLLDIAFSARLVTPKLVDKRVRRILEFVKRASTVKVADVEGPRDLPEDRELNRKLAANGIVLLKNEGNVLPIQPKQGSKIAVIGSLAKYPALSGGGSASLKPYYSVGVLEAIKAAVHPSVEVNYEAGVYAQKMLPVIDSLISHPSHDASGGLIRFFNEPYEPGKTRECVGEEPLNDLYFQLMDYTHNPRLNYNLFFASAETRFTPDVDGKWEIGLSVCGTANLYIDDELVIQNSENQVAGDTFFGKGTAEKISTVTMKKGVAYNFRIEFGSAKTSKLMQVGVVSFGGGGVRLGARPFSDVEDGISRAVQLASESDYTIICTGLNGEWESEAFDRKNMHLPPHTDDLVTRVLQASPNAIVVNHSGTPVTMPWISSSNAVVQAWYGGNEGGNGVADVLLGKVNPSGKLPLSWPVDIKDNPSYLNFGSAAGRVLYGEDIYVGYRGYDALGKDPLFCFGHGLSYTNFALDDLTVTDQQVSFFVSNVGEREGDAVAQVYIAAKSCPVPQATKQLMGFEKVSLAAGQRQCVTVKVDKYATSFWDESIEQWRNEKGEYDIMVGFSSRDIQLLGTFIRSESTTWLGL